MKISHVLEGKGTAVATLWTSRSLRDAIAMFEDKSIASVVITDPRGRPLGILTDRDVIRMLAKRGAAALDEVVTLAMRTPPPVCGAGDTVSSVLRSMTEKRYRHAIVMYGERMIGLVSIGDLVKVRLDDAEIEGRVLRERALGQMAFE